MIAQPYTAFCFISPSGDGLKVGIRVDATRIKNDADFKGAFYQIEELFQTLEFKIDASCKDISRKCFLAHDKDAYFNPDAEIHELDPFPEQKPKAAPTRKPFKPTGNEDSHLQQCINIISNAESGTRHEARLRGGTLLGFAVASGKLDINKKEEYLAALIGASNNISDEMCTSDKEIDTIKKGFEYGLNNYSEEAGDEFEYNPKKSLLHNIKNLPKNPKDSDVKFIIWRAVNEFPRIPLEFHIDNLEKQLGEKLSKKQQELLDDQLGKKSEVALTLHSSGAINNLPVYYLNKSTELGSTLDTNTTTPIKDMILGGDGIYIDDRKMGSGKTKVARELRKACEKNGKKFGYIAHRVSLVETAAKVIDAVSYKIMTESNSAQTSIAACINSIQLKSYLSRNFSGCHCLVIDEVKQVFDHIMRGTVSDSLRNGCYNMLLEFIREVPVIYVADADLNDRVLDILKLAGRPMYRIEGPERPTNVLIKHTDNKTAEQMVVNGAREGKKVLVHADSVETVNLLDNLAKTVAPDGYKILKVHSGNKDCALQHAYLQAPNDVGKQFDMVILSPVVSSGFSIEDVDYDLHIGSFSGQLSPTEIIQTIGRYRNSKRVILGLKNTWRGPTSSIATRVLTIKSYAGEFKPSGKRRVEYILTDFDNALQESLFENDRACENFANTTLLILQQKGYRVEPMAELEISKEDVEKKKVAKEEEKERYIRNVVDAEELSDLDFEELEKQRHNTEKEVFAARKYLCRRELALDHAPTESDVILWDKGRIGTKINNIECVNATQEDHKEQETYDKGSGIHANGQLYSKQKQDAFFDVMAILQGINEQDLGPWKQAILDKDPAVNLVSLQRYDKPRIAEAADYLRKNSDLFEQLSGLGKYHSKNQNSNTLYVGKFLGKFGLNHVRVGDNKEGNYQIDEDSLNDMRAICARRHEKGRSVFNTAKDWIRMGGTIDDAEGWSPPPFRTDFDLYINELDFETGTYDLPEDYIPEEERWAEYIRKYPQKAPIPVPPPKAEIKEVKPILPSKYTQYELLRRTKIAKRWRKHEDSPEIEAYLDSFDDLEYQAQLFNLLKSGVTTSETKTWLHLRDEPLDSDFRKEYVLESLEQIADLYEWWKLGHYGADIIDWLNEFSEDEGVSRQYTEVYSVGDFDSLFYPTWRDGVVKEEPFKLLIGTP